LFLKSSDSGNNLITKITGKVTKKGNSLTSKLTSIRLFDIEFAPSKLLLTVNSGQSIKLDKYYHNTDTWVIIIYLLFYLQILIKLILI
jgi:hypothetical protein